MVLKRRHIRSALIKSIYTSSIAVRIFIFPYYINMYSMCMCHVNNIYYQIIFNSHLGMFFIWTETGKIYTRALHTTQRPLGFAAPTHSRLCLEVYRYAKILHEDGFPYKISYIIRIRVLGYILSIGFTVL